jgi:hypothetical protein
MVIVRWWRTDSRFSFVFQSLAQWYHGLICCLRLEGLVAIISAGMSWWLVILRAWRSGPTCRQNIVIICNILVSSEISLLLFEKHLLWFYWLLLVYDFPLFGFSFDYSYLIVVWMCGHAALLASDWDVAWHEILSWRLSGAAWVAVVASLCDGPWTRVDAIITCIIDCILTWAKKLGLKPFNRNGFHSDRLGTAATVAGLVGHSGTQRITTWLCI